MDELLYTLWMTGPILIFQVSSVLSTDLLCDIQMTRMTMVEGEWMGKWERIVIQICDD
jgi:hypothetical protein